jgi:hypothetical protein
MCFILRKMLKKTFEKEGNLDMGGMMKSSVNLECCPMPICIREGRSLVFRCMVLWMHETNEETQAFSKSTKTMLKQCSSNLFHS